MRNRSFLFPVHQRNTTTTTTSTENNNNRNTMYNYRHQDDNYNYNSLSTDDADVAAGQKLLSSQHSMSPNNNNQSSNNNPKVYMNLSDYVSDHGGSNSLVGSAPSSTTTINTINTLKGHPNDLEFFEDFITEPVLVLGVDITHLNPNAQFAVCAIGLFTFSLLYGYLQELLSVQLCSRKLGLFLAMVQFSGYTSLAYVLRNFVYEKRKRTIERQASHFLLQRKDSGYMSSTSLDDCNSVNTKESIHKASAAAIVPIKLYLGLSMLRAVDLAMTNLAMQYLNYPAKTLMKSSRVVFTMIFGVFIQRKKYKTMDYAVVAAMVCGLALFMHADATSSAVFHHMGVIMLTTSLLCDGAISNMSENMMSQYGIGQDEFIFRMYSIALLAITLGAAVTGDLKIGFNWILQPGTYNEYITNVPLAERKWTPHGKILVMILFSSMGFFGSSCSAAITKNFGALTMSITSTARKATTLFLSFFLFNNVCTAEHIAGIALFLSALTTKSLRRRNYVGKGGKAKNKHGSKSIVVADAYDTNNNNNILSSSPVRGGLVEVIRTTKKAASSRKNQQMRRTDNGGDTESAVNSNHLAHVV